VTTTPSHELLGLAVVAADRAASWLSDHQSGVVVTSTKSTSTDIVTAADTAAEELIRQALQAVRPGDAFLGEESLERQGTTGVRWIVDPIDGTVNYWYGLPTWSVSIAAELDGEVVAAVVQAPRLGRRYTASADGAWCNELPITASTCDDLSQALLATGFSYDATERGRQGAALAELLPQVRDVRRLGSAALDLCLLAAGEVDLYYERGPALWDVAAGAFIAQRAGASVSTDGPLTAGASQALWALFRSALERAGA